MISLLCEIQSNDTNELIYKQTHRHGKQTHGYQSGWGGINLEFGISRYDHYILEKEMAPHSSTLAWKIPWTEKPGRLQSMGSQRVGHDFTFTFTFHFHALEKAMATHSSILAWRIPGMGQPGGLPSLGLHRVGHD